MGAVRPEHRHMEMPWGGQPPAATPKRLQLRGCWWHLVPPPRLVPSGSVGAGGQLPGKVFGFGSGCIPRWREEWSWSLA